MNNLYFQPPPHSNDNYWNPLQLVTSPTIKKTSYESLSLEDKVIRLEKDVKQIQNNNIVIDELHKTIPMLTKYEKTRVLGIRAKQINNGAKPMTKVPDNVMDGYLIALKELEEKIIPVIIRRPLPNGSSEYWKLKDLEII